MAGNLTRNEARDRARLLAVDSYAVELDLTTGEKTFTSVTTVRFRCASPGSTTFIELEAEKVNEIVLNGEAVATSAFANGRIALPPLAASNDLRIHADCLYSRTGEGLHRFTDPVDGEVYLYTHFEPADAHRLFACFDQPDLKATFEFTVTAPAGWTVVSNNAPDLAGEPAGEPVGGESSPGGAPAAPQRVRWHFPPTPVMPTYIAAVCAGPYHEVRDAFDGIPLGIFCRRSLAEYLDPAEIFEVTKQGFAFYHESFGMRYPFGKYDQLFVPEFNQGAMENAGCVTFLEEYVFRSRVTDAHREARAETILHEMAHMWFGDLVTMRWWDDLWLNESFATFAGTLALAESTRWRGAWTTFAQLFKTLAYRQDQLPSTHPISADIPDIRAVEVNFDGITYYKGASVLKQLVAYVGLDNFLAGVRRYFEHHAWANATLNDLLAALEETSGRDLASWSKEWLESAGVNTLRPEFDVGADGALTSFAVVQEAPAEHPALRTQRIAIGLYDRDGGGVSRRHRIELDISGARTEVPELVGRKRPDLVLINDDDLGYAKIRLDESSLRAVVDGIGDITESLPASLCWAAAWDMCRDAEMPARDYARLVTSGVDSVHDITVAQNLLRQATAAVQRFADPAWRENGLIALADAVHSMLQAAEPGSDRQLAYAQTLARTAISHTHLALLAGLLEGTVVIDELAVDTDFRWLLLHRLVSRGVAGETQISAELERDQTSAGERHAARCRAAIPEPEAKLAAWEKIVNGNTMANALFRATIVGFADLDQADLLEPFIGRYFEVVGDIWRTWTSDMAQNFVSHAYPVAVNQHIIEMTDDYIEREQPPAALRRLLVESRDGVERALRAQACDRRAGG
ncbi:MAG: aminopeptidase N [Micromonosporaceae bacterium]